MAEVVRDNTASTETPQDKVGTYIKLGLALGSCLLTDAVLADSPRRISVVDACERAKVASAIADNPTAVPNVPDIAMPDLAEVERYVRDHDLKDFIAEAVAVLQGIFGVETSPDFRMFADPGEGSEMLLVEVPVDNMKENRARFTAFCYDWWYDRIAQKGHLIGFKLTKNARM